MHDGEDTAMSSKSQHPVEQLSAACGEVERPFLTVAEVNRNMKRRFRSLTWAIGLTGSVCVLTVGINTYLEITR